MNCAGQSAFCRLFFFVLHSKKRIASIIVLSVIIAAGALFTAVYDVLYRYNTTNTTILNAATVDNTGKTGWDVHSSAKNGNETITTNFDQGTWILCFMGQGQGRNGSYGAECIAFYKGSSMTVSVGIPGGKGGASDGSKDGNGSTYVQSNFALPTGTNAGTAIAGGAGGGYSETQAEYYQNGADDLLQIMDGTFRGWSGNDRNEVSAKMGITFIKGIIPNTGWPATQSTNGIDYYGNGEMPDPGYGGGAGYFNGGGGWIGGDQGAGGSCSPNCYPLMSSDIQTGPRMADGSRARRNYPAGGVWGYRMDPRVLPSGGTVKYGARIGLVEGEDGNKVRLDDDDLRGIETRTPYGAVNDVLYGLSDRTIPVYDCGIRVGWVYSCSEDGEKWGASSDDLVSVSETKHLA